MKHYLFLATAIATASLFTGCSNNEYVGDQPDAPNGTDGAIVFSMGKANTTRAVDGTSQLQNNGFYVYGEKYYAATLGTPQKVFDTYKVTYTNGTTSPSNSKGWEYVGNLWTNVNERNNVHGGVDNQTIKYWDYSADHYTFYAFSVKPDDVTGSTPYIQVSAIDKSTTTDPKYTVTITGNTHIDNLYFADKKVVKKDVDGYAGPEDNSPADKVVTLKFRNLASKVRFGFYETVPGYRIVIDKMYKYDNSEATGFAAICPNIKVLQPSEITVKYYSEDHEKYPNYAYVFAIKNGESVVNPDQTFESDDAVLIGPTLSITSSSPTWDNGGNYTFVWPQETNNTPLKIKVDYTLKSTDGSGETIKVKGATATIPAAYVAWKANTAYTYIFKISDNTNGTTGGSSDPAGLYPITFDAAVFDMDMEGFVTTVSTPSVTAKQDGATTGYVSASGIVFQLNKPIELKVMNGENPVESPVISGDYIEGDNYKYDLTPEQNLRAASKSIDNPISGTQLAEKNTKGYWVLKVATSSEASAAFTYVIIRVGAAEEGPANS